MDKHKYSVAANEKTISFLVTNGIWFVFRKGFQTQRRRVYFIASLETRELLREMTGWHAADEDDGWDFDGWDAIERK